MRKLSIHQPILFILSSLLYLYLLCPHFLSLFLAANIFLLFFSPALGLRYFPSLSSPRFAFFCLSRSVLAFFFLSLFLISSQYRPLSNSSLYMSGRFLYSPLLFLLYSCLPPFSVSVCLYPPVFSFSLQPVSLFLWLVSIPEGCRYSPFSSSDVHLPTLGSLSSHANHRVVDVFITFSVASLRALKDKETTESQRQLMKYWERVDVREKGI